MILVHGGTCFHQLFKTVAYTQNPGFRVNECNRDITSIIRVAGQSVLFSGCCIIDSHEGQEADSQTGSGCPLPNLSRGTGQEV
jgi:hypothetical protein